MVIGTRSSRHFVSLAAAGLATVGIAPAASAQLGFRNPIFEDLSRIGIPLDAAVGDLDNDGFDDVVIALAHPEDPDNIPGRLLVLYNKGLLANPADMFELRFNAFVSDGITQRPSAVELADYDEDGFLDIVVVSSGVPGDGVSDPITVLLNSQEHTDGFLAADVLTTPVGNEPIDFAVEDFDADGDVDFAVLLFGDIAIQIADNPNGGTPRVDIDPPNLDDPPEPLPGLADPTSVEPGDFDNAARPGLAVSGGGSAELRILTPAGARSFDQTSVPLNSIPLGLAVAPIVDQGPRSNTDEIIVTLPAEEQLGILIRDPQTGEYDVFGVPADDSGIPAVPSAVATADFNGDEAEDIAFVVELDLGADDRKTQFVTLIRVLRNQTQPGGSPAFDEPVDVEPDSPPTILLTGDLNNDGQPDFVTVNQNEVDLSGPPDVTSVVGNPDPFDPACELDLNYDGVIDLADLLTLLAFFGQPTPAGDVDGDDDTDLDDLVLLLELFGSECGGDGE